MTTYTDAIDEMFAMVKDVFDEQIIYAYVIDVRWPGVPQATQPDKSKLWARVSHKVSTDQQASLANANGNRIYVADGMMYIQLFAPRNVGGSLDSARALAKQLQNEFRSVSTTGEIWYSHQKIEELPEGEDNYPILVSTQYQYKTLSTVAA